MSAEERFSIALSRAARGWQVVMNRRLRELGITQAGWIAMGIVASARGSLSQSELAHRAGVEGASMVAMIDRLARARLVERSQVDEDRRVKHVLLTPAGRDLYKRLRVETGAVHRGLLEGVDPATLRAATGLLEHVLRVTHG